MHLVIHNMHTCSHNVTLPGECYVCEGILTSITRFACLDITSSSSSRQHERDGNDMMVGYFDAFYVMVVVSNMPVTVFEVATVAN